ncbi:uncharacterized protein LOC120076236 [Benincasa hispida]|uniref:uncharacterized protein LOC120076236 n=1 Tax=Benincasa hispida TaxID=102211 RepID=UPI001900447D|nr:uncharacterized protein LOC120076236 [Benincasa hispida]
MTTTRYEIEKFEAKTDFELWKAKIKVVLRKQKALLAITDPAKYPKILFKAEKETIESNAYGTIVLNVIDSVLRQIVDRPTAYALWNKLNDIYLNKDLPNKAFLRERFFTYKMDPAKSLTDNLNEFKSLSSDFRSIGDNIGEENEAFILLNSLPETFKDVKTALKYGRERITTYAIISAVSVKELELQMTKKDQPRGEGFFPKGNNKTMGRANRTMEMCIRDSMKKDCYALKRKLNQQNKGGKQTEAAVGENSLVYSDALAATE